MMYAYFKKVTCSLLILSFIFPPGLVLAAEAEPLEGPPPISSSVRNRLKALYRTQDTLPKLIEDDSIPEQRMEEYYVELQLNDDKGPEEKTPIELKDMFKDLPKDKNKVLITGGAGIGKSTLLHHITYEWGMRKVFEDLFEVIFTVKLKKLASDVWRSKDPATTERPLETLVFSSLYDQQQEARRKGIETLEGIELEEESIVSLEEVTSLLKKDQRSKVLLLLDGYDEVAGLASRRGSVAEEIINKLFTFPNVVMTSRPNALSSGFKERFNRQIETRGLSGGGINQYIRQYFHESPEAGENLIRLSHINPALKDAMLTPINAAMICLISQEPEFEKKFRGSFPLGRLYEEVVVWLGKRYMLKFPQPGEDFFLRRILTERIYALGEFQTLSQTAYESFKDGIFTLNARSIEKVAITKRTHLDRVIQYGLLRSYNSDMGSFDLYSFNNDYGFIHLSFHEYMMAYVLKSTLGGGRDTPTFIGEHRHEPRYLMTLKLLAGIMNTQGESEEEDAGRPDSTFTHFWEAVICNVDGILELGAGTKVRLLMHLLGQTPIEEAQYVPNVEKVQGFMDDIILSNLTGWREEIIQSGYMSRTIANHLLLVLDEAGAERLLEEAETKRVHEESVESEQKIDQEGLGEQAAKTFGEGYVFTQGGGAGAPAGGVPKTAGEEGERKVSAQKSQWEKEQELKVAIEVITALINKKDYWERRNIFKKLMNIVRHTDNWKLINLGLKKLTEVLDQTIPKDHQEDLLQLIGPLMKDDNHIHDTQKLFIRIIQVDAGRFAEVLNFLRPLLSDKDDKVRSPAWKSLGEVGKEIIKVAPEKILEVLDLFLPLLSDENKDVRRPAVQNLGDVGGELININPQKVSEVLDLLRPLLSDSEEDVRRSAVQSLGDVLVEIMKAAPEKYSEVLNLLTFLLSDKYIDIRISVWERLSDMRKKIVKEWPKRSLEILNLLRPLPSNKDEYARISEAKSLNIVKAELIKTTPEKLSEMFNLYLSILSNKDKYKWGRNSSEILDDVLVEIIKANPKRSEEVFALLKPLLSSKSWNIREYAVMTVGGVARELFKHGTEHRSEVFALFKTLLSDKDLFIRKYVVQSLGKVGAEIIKLEPKQGSEVLELLKPLLSDENDVVRRDAAGSLGKVGAEIIKHAPEYRSEVLELLKPLLSDKDWFIRISAMQSFGAVGAEIIKHAPEYRSEVLALLKPLISDIHRYIRRSAAESLGEVGTEIVKHAPEYRSEVLALLKPLLSDKDWCTRVSAMQSLGAVGAEVVKTDPEKGSEVFALLKALLLDENWRVRESATWSLGKVGPEIVKNAPEYRSEVLALLKPLLSGESCNIRKYAVYDLGEVGAEIVKHAPEYRSEVLALLKPLLSGESCNIRKYAVYGLGKVGVEIVKHAPEYRSEVLALLKPLLSDENDVVRRGAAENLGKVGPEIVKNAPEYSSEILELLKPLLSDKEGDVRLPAAQSLGEVGNEIVKHAPEHSSEVFVLLKLLLSDKDWVVRKNTEKSINTIIQSPSDLGVLASLLEDEIKTIREMAHETLLSRLKDPEWTLTYKDTFALLKIIQSTSEEDELNKVAKSTLKRLGTTIEREGIIWLNERFGDFPSLPETTSFLKEVCPHVLKDGKITQEDADFLINCIKRGVTVMITREGTILFEGTPYKLSQEK